MATKEQFRPFLDMAQAFELRKDYREAIIYYKKAMRALKNKNLSIDTEDKTGYIIMVTMIKIKIGKLSTLVANKEKEPKAILDTGH